MTTYDDYKKALAYDPLLEATRLTGRPHWTPETIDLAGELGVEQRVRIATLLEEMADTTYSMRFDGYLRTAGSAGFERILEEQVGAEEMVVLGRASDAILLVVDSYRGNLNSAFVQFRWTGTDFPAAGLVDAERISYGRAQAWACSFDAREGLLARLSAMEEGDGAFLAQWWNRPPGAVPGGMARLWLEQDEQAARKLGLSRGELQAHLENLSRSRAERLPETWRSILDVDGTRSEADAIASA
jgi:hypothetical protein